MTISKFMTDHYKTKCKYNKTTTGYQCVDLAKAYCAEVLDVYKKYPSLANSWAWGNAIDWGTPNTISKKIFVFSDNRNNIKAGCLVVFKTSSKYGHIAVSTGFEDGDEIITLDQNYGKTESAQFVKHKKSTIKKVLIPK